MSTSKPAEKTVPATPTLIPSKLEVDMGPRTQSTINNLFPQIFKFGWGMLFIFVVLAILGFGLFWLFASQMLSFFHG